jgi:hypothetical protein
MRLSFPVPPTPVDSIVPDELTSKKPTTLLLHTNRPYIYNYWTLNDRLRLKNEKLSRRQQSSCRIAFYSLWLCIIASVMIIVIYRFTDECPLTTNQKEFFIKCLRHWFFLLAICTSLCACSGVIFGACRYFRSQPRTFSYGIEHDLHVGNNNNVLPMTTMSQTYCYPTSLANGTAMIPFGQTRHRDDEQSITSITNPSPRRMIPPFDYDELPPETSSIMIQKSPNHNNKTVFFSSSVSTTSSPRSIFSTTATSNATNRIINSKATSISQDTYSSMPATYTPCACGRDVWEKQQRLPTLL